MSHLVDTLPNFPAVLRHWAVTQPQRVAFHFLPDGESVQCTLTFGELDERARALAAVLQTQGWHGAPLLLQYPPGLDFIVAFFACQYMGAIPVPAYPPTSNRSKSERLAALVKDCGARAVLTSTPTRASLEGALGEVSQALPMLCTDGVSVEGAGDWRDPGLHTHHAAFLQYSSGSTGDPKGVVITHGNLMHNQRTIREAMGNGPHTVFASWLPLFHDMGLVGNVMQPLYLGVPCFLMPPMAFLQQPRRWLQVISTHRVTCTGGPNFAYDLCVDKVPEAERAGLDLSSWRVAYNGSEVVRAQTVHRFVQAYRAQGLSAHAAYPCYGLAEGTLLVTGPPPQSAWRECLLDGAALARGEVVLADRDAVDARAVTSCGRVWGEQSVRIVDPVTGITCQPGCVGELWLQGPSVSPGYWNRPDLDATLFGTPADAPEAGRHCRTGDLGFFEDGELYVTGRLKEMLIIRGRNHYPQDIEHTVQSAWPGFQRGGGAVFQDGDRLILVQEIARTALRGFDPAQAERMAREAVAREHGLSLTELVAIKPATLAKTSSGKIRRGATREGYRGATLALAVPATPVRAVVLQERAGDFALLHDTLVAMGLPAAALEPGTTLPQLGLDSLQVIDLQARLARRVITAPALEDLFNGPTLAQLAMKLSPRAVADTAPIEPTLPDSPPDAGPIDGLSPYQLAIWLRQQQTAAPIYNLALALEFDAALSAEHLIAELQRLLHRHPHLHQGVRVDTDDLPRGHALPVPEVERTCIDGWTEPQLDDALRGFRARPFHLELEPPCRAQLFEREGHGPLLALAVHHLVIDFQGAANLVDELLQRLGSGRPADLPGSSAQVVAPLQAAQGGLDGAWLDRLAAANAELDLGVAAPRPVVAASLPCAQWRGTIDADLLAALRQTAADTGATLNAVLAAGFAALLHRYGGQRSLCLGMPFTVRSAPLAAWPGNAVNMVPLAFEFPAQDSARALILRTTGAITEGLHHRHVPLMQIAAGVRERQPSRTTLFDAVFACQPQRTGPQAATAELLVGSEAWHSLQGPDGSVAARVRSRPIDASACQALFTMIVVPGPHDARVSLEFDPSRIPEDFAGRVLTHYTGMLRSIVRDPDAPLNHATWLPADELHRQWITWNAGGHAVPSSQPPGRHLVSMFLAQVEAQPGALAVLDAAGHGLRYDELAQSARRLAATLQRHGVARGDCVGIALPRDHRLPAALIGVLMCGAAYVPLDLDYPVERLRHILVSSGARHVLTVPAFADDFTRAGALCVFPNEAEPIDVDTPPVMQSDDLAYVLYTSGSTGQPKGVQVTHGNVVALLDWAQHAFTPAERARVLASTSVCFDLSVFEFFVPLCLGTTCVVVARILDLLDAAPADVTMINTVPSAIEALLAAGAVPDSVTTALVAGEPFRQTVVDRLYAQSRVRRVLDLYGPTEDTVYSTVAERLPHGLETIGRPLPGTRAYVLDAAGQPVPIGVAGELYLAGAGLSRGYRGRDDLTDAAFVRPASIAHLETRVYRTGDIVRYRADGMIVYIGRRDHQVKVRGYRIELQEIEAALAGHPAVREAVAHVVAVAHGEPALVACVVWHDGVEAAPRDRPALDQHVAARLPAYMRPAVVMTLGQLPRTLNGKVDRRALPQLVEVPSAPSALTDPFEIELAEAWREVLGSPPTQREDHFVELGGHSLSAVRLRVVLQRRLAIDVPLAVLLAAPAFGSQANLLRGLRAAAQIPAGEEGAAVEEFEL